MSAPVSFKGVRQKAGSIRLIAMVFFICMSIAVILLSVGSSYQAYRSSLLETIGTNRSDLLSQIGGRVRDFKSNAYTISNLYWNNEKFKTLARGLNDESKEDFFAHMDELTRQYKISFNQVNLDYYVVYLSAQGIGYCSSGTPADYDYMNPEIRIWYKDIYEAKGGIVDVASFKDKALGINSFVAARTVLEEDGSIAGYLMINVNERQIFNTYSDVVAPESNIYIADENGNILSTNKNNIVGFHYFHMENLKTLFGGKVYAIVQLPHSKALFSKYTDAAYHFTVFEETPLDYILQPIRATRNAVVGIACGVILLGVLLAWKFSGLITKPILQLRDYVLRVKDGDMDTGFVLNSYSEINTLSLGIQQMLMRIKMLMESEKKKEEQKRKMQYHLLQAQINPHFMYNTLFSIKCVVDMNENKKASQMLAAFIQLLRGTLSNPDSMTNVRRQVETLKQYADLQRFRYGDCFDVIIEYDETIGECLIPQLLIQPVVENAILHGMVESQRGNGMITVLVRQKQDTLVIEVEDNGIGMLPQAVQEALEGEEPLDRLHIGLKNIRDRIQLSFGDSYGLYIESRYREGTMVRLTLPLLKAIGRNEG